MTKQVLMTDEGLKNLEAELEELKAVKRKEIAEKIKVATGVQTIQLHTGGMCHLDAEMMRLKMSKPSLKLESLLLKICLKM